MADLILLLIALASFVMTSSGIGTLLLWYATGMRRFSGFFTTLQETVSWALFVILGLEALFSYILCYVANIFSCFCPLSNVCRINMGMDLFLHSTLLTLFGLGLAVTIIQFLLVRDHYRLDDWLLFCLLGVSSYAGCAAWLVCQRILL